MEDALTEVPERETVLWALRLGWAFAEVRGRLQTGPQAQLRGVRPENALPLADERSWSEQTIETEEIANRLARKLDLDFKQSELTGQHGDGTASARLVELSRALHAARDAKDEAKTKVRWGDFCQFLWAWDSKIQDRLAADSFAAASAYQLGRGLAEVYWALDPTLDEPDDPRSALFLLGPGRLLALERILPRLSTYFTSTTAKAVQTSLAAWAQVAKDGIFKSQPDAARQALHEQLRVWHDLLLVGQAPETLVSSQDLVTRARRVGPVLRAFVPEVLIGSVSLTAAAAAAALFALGTGSSAIAPVLAVLSFFGVTSAGALAKAKGEAHSLFEQLQHAMDLDLVKEAVTLPPARAYLDLKRRPLRNDPRRRALEELAPAQRST